MSLAILITEENQIDPLIQWAWLLARAESTDLELILLQKSRGDRGWIEAGAVDETELPPLAQIAAGEIDRFKETRTREETEPDSDGETAFVPEIRIRILQAPDPETAIVAGIEELDLGVLVVPESGAAGIDRSEVSWIQRLYGAASCEIIHWAGCAQPETGAGILVIVNGDNSDEAAVRRGLSIASATDGELTAILFEPPIDDWAVDVGKKILSRQLRSIAGNDADRIRQKVVLARSVGTGINELDLDQYQLVLGGVRDFSRSRKFLNHAVFTSVAEQVAVATVRKAMPWSGRIAKHVRDLIEAVVPQLDREQRVNLMARMQSSSQWDFDFGVLISLSTLIAALGLIRNSASVVIGAMLVAPLMTPIVGGGLGLAQSNIWLLRRSLRTVLRGFATAFVLGAIVGLVLRPELTKEMADRGSPGFLDLMVALASGMAAAYAMGRPNLLSALPGVAIAAALVPPLATSGIALAIGAYHDCLGALVLFVTNIVAIILGATITFWLVGIRKQKQGDQTATWPIAVFCMIVLISVLLTIFMSVGFN